MFKYFTKEEFVCKETGENEIEEELIFALDELREHCGFPFVITSGYRSPDHPIELKKKTPGTHAQGIAADIAVSSGLQRYIIVKNAIKLGFTGIGVAGGFVHVDIRATDTPVMWTYS
jgi:zinc D-Ala-D-Ala carboxypeptidase|tara:strand:- start:534 stop:884 length:351 start_codon:yes stop_codon:yes gene_type:complete